MMHIANTVVYTVFIAMMAEAAIILMAVKSIFSTLDK